jgi:hypothetical protein
LMLANNRFIQTPLIATPKNFSFYYIHNFLTLNHHLKCFTSYKKSHNEIKITSNNLYFHSYYRNIFCFFIIKV